MSREPDVHVSIAVRQWWPSSNIAGIGYDEDSETLEVQFKDMGTGGSRYRYGNVTLKEAAPLLTRGPVPNLLRGLTPGMYLSTMFVRQTDLHPYVRMEREA